MTNSPLGRVLLNPEASSQLIKWMTELSEFDIQYQPRTTIKAQSLADFVTEMQNPESEAIWRIYVDGSSTRQGSGVDILLISPQGERMQLSVRLDYKATNNEAEYEALIAGLQAARHVGAIKANFWEVVIHKILQLENQAADELAKLASSLSSIIIPQPIEQVSLVAHVDRMEGLSFPSDWRMTLVEFLRSGATPSDEEEARILRRRVGWFTLIGDQLYKKAFSRPLLKCVRSEDVDYILREVHQGSCGGHPGGRSLARKILLAGYLCPTLQEDVARTVATCLSCQKYHSLSHRSIEEMKAPMISFPFDQWGMDIVGSFPMAIGQRKFLLVAVDYFSKWVEAELLARISKQMCGGYVIQQAFTSVVYPQSNGQAEVANQEILRVLRARLDHMGFSWVDELPSVLWALRMTPKEGTGATSFHLVYDSEAVIPVEVEVESDWLQHYDEDNIE
ncbi:uncharacterized protein LOC122031549 [Zingiber officinale]|uniref:uncharacterized protein LOC122031549 n=1 Tax=Zingiber officinale TaxID=94328 RepID=UPI001C4B6CCC|nr:uncharacterized protein LOC122031549 [Zingiber officinale]